MENTSKDFVKEEENVLQSSGSSFTDRVYPFSFHSVKDGLWINVLDLRSLLIAFLGIISGIPLSIG